LCGLGAPAGQAQAAIASSCCGTDHCCPRGHCSCQIAPQNTPDEKSVAVPTPVTDGSVFAITPSAAATVSPDAGPATPVVAFEAASPRASHAFCLSNRAPPLS
jgi:hypothetical protein